MGCLPLGKDRTRVKQHCNSYSPSSTFTLWYMHTGRQQESWFLLSFVFSLDKESWWIHDLGPVGAGKRFDKDTLFSSSRMTGMKLDEGKNRAYVDDMSSAVWSYRYCSSVGEACKRTVSLIVQECFSTSTKPSFNLFPFLVFCWIRNLRSQREVIPSELVSVKYPATRTHVILTLYCWTCFILLVFSTYFL